MIFFSLQKKYAVCHWHGVVCQPLVPLKIHREMVLKSEVIEGMVRQKQCVIHHKAILDSVLLFVWFESMHSGITRSESTIFYPWLSAML